jgi:uncharacterized paraquat-inducible protein A
MNLWNQYVDALPKFEKVWSVSTRLRTETANSMMSEPLKWKVCGVCSFAMTRKHKVCPSCHAYQFIYEPEIIQFLAATTKLTRPTMREISSPVRYGKEHE